MSKFNPFKSIWSLPLPKSIPRPKPAITIVTSSPAIKPEQEKLLRCSIHGCNTDANPNNAIPTGVLGLGRAWVYLCDRHASERVAALAEYRKTQAAKKAPKEA